VVRPWLGLVGFLAVLILPLPLPQQIDANARAGADLRAENERLLEEVSEGGGLTRLICFICNRKLFSFWKPSLIISNVRFSLKTQ